MRTSPLVLTALFLAGCAHHRGDILTAPADGEIRTTIDAEVRAKISFYEKADATAFVAECASTGKWRLLCCVVLESQFTTFPGLTQGEKKHYVVEMQIPSECIDFYGVAEGVFGESLELRSKLRDVHEAYAARVNRAVIAALEKRTTAGNTRK